MPQENTQIDKNLIEIQPLIEMLELTLQTAFILPYNPLSLLIIGKPESAKTSSMQNFINNDWIYYTNEITAKMLIDKVLDKAKDKKIRFLMIPDLLNSIEKQKSSRQQFLNLIKSSIEEGILKIDTYYKKIESKEPIKIGFITAITRSSFYNPVAIGRNKLFFRDAGIKKYLEETGILSRFIPFSYDYPIDKIKIIFDKIKGMNIKTQKVIYRKIDTKETEIKGNPELFNQLEIVSRTLGLNYGAYGIRTQQKLQLLTKANAKIEGRKEVIQEDINKILYLSKWINYDFNPI